MKRFAYLPLGFAVALALSACGSQEPSSDAPEASASEDGAADNQAQKAALPACPFQQTRDWHATIENGRILVNGRVDLLMAGFKPTLTPRPEASAGAIAFDLSLQPEQGAVVNEQARYENSVSGRYGKAEIYCGGELIETIDIVQIG